MTLIVEDGSNVADANSYLTLADADAYHTLHGNADWPATTMDNTATKELALIRATSSIELLYGQRYKSIPQYAIQSLLWPRQVMVINRFVLTQSGTIPKQLKDAVAEVALMSLNGEDIFPLPNANRAINSKSVTVGEISTSVSYSGAPPVEQFAGFNKIDLILVPLLRSEGGGSFTMSL